MKPLFHHSWWLDAAAGENMWGISSVIDQGKVEASLPYVIKNNKLGFKCITQPPFTPYLGPYISKPKVSSKYTTILTREKKLLNQLINLLPNYDFFSQTFSPEITNWYPFFQNEFKQTTYYTYRLKGIENNSLIWEGFQPKIKTDIRKAIKRKIKIEQSDNIESLINLMNNTYARQDIKTNKENSILERIIKESISRNSGAIFLAIDKDKKIHAGCFIAFDENCSYYIAGGGDPKLRNSGATSLCLWEAIKFSSRNSKIFDFEGSMIPSIERYFRGFGGQQTQLFHVSKIRSKRLHILKNISSLF